MIATGRKVTQAVTRSRSVSVTRSCVRSVATTGNQRAHAVTGRGSARAHAGTGGGGHTGPAVTELDAMTWDDDDLVWNGIEVVL